MTAGGDPFPRRRQNIAHAVVGHSTAIGMRQGFPVAAHLRLARQSGPSRKLGFGRRGRWHSVCSSDVRRRHGDDYNAFSLDAKGDRPAAPILLDLNRAMQVFALRLQSRVAPLRIDGYTITIDLNVSERDKKRPFSAAPRPFCAQCTSIRRFFRSISKRLIALSATLRAPLAVMAGTSSWLSARPERGHAAEPPSSGCAASSLRYDPSGDCVSSARHFAPMLLW